MYLTCSGRSIENIFRPLSLYLFAIPIIVEVLPVPGGPTRPINLVLPVFIKSFNIEESENDSDLKLF